MDVTIVAFPDAAQAEELFALRRAVHAADAPDEPTPLWPQFLAETQQTSREIRREWATARTGDTLVGAAKLTIPQIDHRQLAEVFVEVHPDHRRRGIGRSLMARLFQRIEQEDRPTVVAGTTGSLPGGPPRPEAGSRFLERLGFAPGLSLIQRRLDLRTVDPVSEQRLAEQCQRHTTDYEVHTWAGQTPDRLADAVVYLTNRLSSDAPAGDLALEQTTMDTDRLHAEERNLLATHQLISAAAWHRESGEPAAVSRIKVSAAGDHGWVLLTLVDPKHRGHRLGMLLKIAVHRLARQTFPELGYLYTGNANSNTHMAAINERLGFADYQCATIYQHHRQR